MARLSEVDVRKLKKIAKDKMQEGRDSTLGQMGRSAERYWDHGGGKKTAMKVGVGVFVGVEVAAIGVATHGLGLPIIFGLAIGGFTVGQMSDTAFAKLWGRQYTGGKRTQEWLNNFKVIDSIGKSELADERAHKTVRRAFQHYRTACSNARNLKLALRSPQTCDQAYDMMIELLGVKRHLDKARLYLFPAMYLLRHVLEYQDVSWKHWSGKDDQAARADWHPAKFCVISVDPEACVYTGHTPTMKPLPNTPWNRGAFDAHHEITQLDHLKNQLGTDPLLRAPKPQNVEYAVQRMFADAERDYNENRAIVKLKHGVTNTWQRKTTREQVAFGMKKGASVALAGGSMGVHIHFDEAFGAIAALVDAAFSSPDILLEEAVERMGPETPTRTPDIELQGKGARVGAEAQEGLHKAAVHVWEMHEAWTTICKANNDGDAFIGHSCSEAIEYLRQVYKIQHHLLKTQGYLTETIEKVVDLAERIDAGLTALTNISNIVFKSINGFMVGHAFCTEGNCYKTIQPYHTKPPSFT